MTIASVRLPVDALVAKSRLTIHHIAELAEMDPRQIYRDRELGGFTPTVADRISIALGYTAEEVWGTDWWPIPDVPEAILHRREVQAAYRARIRAERQETAA